MQNFADDAITRNCSSYVSFDSPMAKVRAANMAALANQPQVTNFSPTGRIPRRTLLPTEKIDPKTETPIKKRKEIGAQQQIPVKVTTSIPPLLRPVVTMEYTLNCNDINCFYGRDNFLSNFYTYPLKIEGHRYYSVEHYYEAVKLFSLVGPQGSVQLQSVKDACAAKTVSRRLISAAKIDRKRVEQWRRCEGVKVVMVSFLYCVVLGV